MPLVFAAAAVHAPGITGRPQTATEQQRAAFFPAYQRLREEAFELLLTDIVMPEMDGIELARRASELDPDLKIMFITGFAAVALNADSAAPRNAKVLSKPVHLRELVHEVQKLLAA